MTITLVEIDANVQGDSSTTLTIGTGAKTFVLDSDQPFIAGMSVTARYDDSNDMSGTITRVRGLNVTVNVSSVNGSGSHSAWELNGDRTLYAATESYTSNSGVEYIGDIADPGDIEQNMFSEGSTLGASKATKGNIVFNNKDGAWDFVRKLGFKKGSLRIKQIADQTYDVPSDNVFAGNVLYPECGFDTIDFSVSDRLSDLDVPAQEAVFAGTNAGPVGIEGSAGGIKGQTKPFGYGGQILNVKAKLLNEAKNIWGVMFDYAGATDSITSFDDVKDEGLTKTKDTGVGTSGDVANLAALQAATITSGQYATCLAEGLYRFSGAPNGIVTCDFTHSTMTGAAIVKALIERIGLTSSDYVNSTFTSVDSDNGNAQEIYVEDDSTVLRLSLQIMSGMGGYIISDTDNKIRVGLLKNPADGTSVKTFDEYSAINLTRLESKDPGKGIPPRQIKLNYRKNYTEFSDSEFAGAVTDTTRLLLGNQWRQVVGDENGKIARKHPNAPIFEIDTHFVSEANALTELSRQETLRQTDRDFYQFATYDLTPLNLGDVITLQIDGRFDLSDGFKSVIVGKNIELKKSRIVYTVWG